MFVKVLPQLLTVLATVVTALPAQNLTDCPALPASFAPGPNSKLPDPFMKADGTRITTKAEWTCQRNFLSQLLQKYELGEYPPPPESVTASLTGNTLAVTVNDQGKSITFSVSINKPAGTGPFPAIIAFGGASFPIPSGIATIGFRNDDIAAQMNTGSRGKGKFYDLYGSGATASALLAWAWGIDRLVDALEKVPEAGIDPTKLGVTGCSRNGKGAMVAGAFVERIALTIPQESGSGGVACWRLSDEMKRKGVNVQTASQIVTENVWMSKSFEPYVNSIPNLPIDNHELAALIAPRAMIVIENTSQEWSGSMSTYGCMKTAHKVWEALGIPERMGFSQVGNHNHCQFPSSQGPDLNAFVDKFLRGTGTAETNFVKTDGNLGFSDGDWVDWTTPSLT